MLDWDSLTEAGQMRRLRPLAMAALDRYRVTPRRLRLIGGFTNVIFRVDADEGVFAIRVDLHQDHSDRDVQIELEWLDAIAADTDVDAARPVTTRSGDPFVYAEALGVPGARRCVLFEWIPGRPLADRPDEAGYEGLGRLSASLHRHGAGHVPSLRPMAWDKVFYWPEEIDPVVIHEPAMAHHFTDGRRETLDRAIDIVTEAFDRLDPDGAHIIHGDLHPWNVHVHRSRLIALDFEDVAWGHPVQDVAISLYYLRDEPAYPQLREAFRLGYSAVAEWPESYEGEVDVFIAARRLMFVNYVANLLDDPSDFYAKAFPKLEQFVATAR